MTQIRQPSVTVSRLSGLPTAGITDQKLLLVGQKTSAGSATDGELVTNIGNDSDIWDGLGGENSMIVAMIRVARGLNPLSQIDAIFLDDAGAGVAAAGTLVVGGTSTEAGTLEVVIGSKTDFTFSISIASATAADTVGDQIVAAITAATTAPVTVINTLGSIAVTAVNVGTYGNSIGLAIYGTVAGLTTSVGAMTGGATDPTLTNVFDVIGDQRYQGIVWPYADDLTPLTTLLDARFNPTDAILDGVGFVSTTDTFANLLTYLDAENSPSLCVNVDQIVLDTAYTAPAVFEIPVLKATSFAAIRAIRGTTGANIGQFVITNNALDSFGGPALASKPYFNTPLPNMQPVDIDKGFTSQEIESLLAAGGWVLGNNVAANAIIAGEVVTTSKTDSAGNDDNTFTFLNSVDTSSGISEFFFNNLKTRYAQYRLTSGALIPGRDSANALLIRAFVIELYQTLGGSDYALVQTGVSEIDGETVDLNQFFDDNLSVTLDLTQGQVTIDMTVVVVVQLRTILVPITLLFSPSS